VSEGKGREKGRKEEGREGEGREWLPSNWGVWIRQWRREGRGEGQGGELGLGHRGSSFFHFKHC